MGIIFIQYLRPNGRRHMIQIDRKPEIEALAKLVENKGCRFECEVLGDGKDTVSFTVFDMSKDEDIAIVLVPNGVKVPDAVDDLVMKAAKKLGIETNATGTSA